MDSLELQLRAEALKKNFEIEKQRTEERLTDILHRREALRNEISNQQKQELQELKEELSVLESKFTSSEQEESTKVSEEPSHDAYSEKEPFIKDFDKRREYDLCICYAESNGQETAESLQKELKKLNINVVIVACKANDKPTDEEINHIKFSVARSRAFGLVLTQNSLKLGSLMFAARVSLYYDIRIILIHDQASCLFPSVAEQPKFLANARVFQDKAVTYLSQFADVCAQNIMKKIQHKISQSESTNSSANININVNDESHKGSLFAMKNVHSHQYSIKTRGFLSHKRSTGQGIAGRLYQGLKADYKIFLDSEADFDLHDLQVIVKHTDLFMFILTEGVFDSFWCLQELRSALEYGKQILIIKDQRYKLPTTFPPHLADLTFLFHSTVSLDSPEDKVSLSKYTAPISSIVYSQENYENVIKEIRTLLGATDSILEMLCSRQNAKGIWKFDQRLLHHLNLPLAGSESVIVPAPVAATAPKNDNSNTTLTPNPRRPSVLITKQQVQNLLKFWKDKEQVKPSKPATSKISMSSHRGPSQEQKKPKSDLTKYEFLTLSFTPTSGVVPIERVLEAIEGYYKFPLDFVGGLVCHTASDKNNSISFGDGFSRFLKSCPNLTRLTFSEVYLLQDSDLQKLVENDCQLITSLTIHRCDSISDIGLKYLAQSKCKFKHLSLSSLSKVTDQGLTELLTSPAVSELESLVLRALKMTDAPLVAFSKKVSDTLKHIEFQDLEITDASMAALSLSQPKFANIEVIILEALVNVTSNGLETLLTPPSSAPSKLAVLQVDAESSDYSSVAFTHLKNFPNFSRLSFRNSAMDKNHFKLLSQCKNLNYLLLLNPRGAKDEDIRELFLPESGTSLVKLKTLILDHVDDLTDLTMHYISKSPSAQTIHNLAVTGLIHVTNMNELLASLPQLTSIKLYGIKSLNPECFQHIPNIKAVSIDLYNSDNIDDILQHMAKFKGTPKMESLFVNTARTASDQFLAKLFSLPPAILEKIQSLSFPGSNELTLQAIEEIVKCPHLKNIKHIFGTSTAGLDCPQILKIISKASFASGLQTLRLTGVNKLHEDDVLQLVEACPNLYSFEAGMTTSAMEYYLASMGFVGVQDRAEYDTMSPEDLQNFNIVKNHHKYLHDIENVSMQHIQRIRKIDEEMKLMQFAYEQESSRIRRRINFVKKKLGLHVDFSHSMADLFSVFASSQPVLQTGHPTGSFKGMQFEFDACFLYSGDAGTTITAHNLIFTGLETVNAFLDYLPSSGAVRFTSLECPRYEPSTFDEQAAEKKIAKSRVSIMILTENVLNTPSFIFALTASVMYKHRIIVVHCESSCAFPTPQEQPHFIQDADILGGEFISFSIKDLDTCAASLVSKLKPKKPESTRAYITCKRLTGKGIASRLYQGLKDTFKVFFDPASDVDLSEAEELIKSTQLFILVLTDGVFKSYWTVQELLFALKHNKEILLIQDYQSTTPSDFPPELEEHRSKVESLLPQKILYMAEFYQACLEKIVWKTGPPDRVIDSLQYERNKPLNQALNSLNPASTQEREFQYFHPHPCATTLREFVSLLYKTYSFPMDKITRIELPRNNSLEIDSIPGIFRLAPNIHKFIVDMGEKITDNSFAGVEEGEFKALRVLHLPNCSKLSDVALSQIAKGGCTNLESFNLRCNMQVTEKGLSSLLSQNVNLHSLELSDSFRLAGSAYSFLVPLKHLKVLNITSGVFDDEGCKYLASCTSLQVLKAANTKITDAGAKVLAESLHSLVELDISGVKGITDAGFTALVEANATTLETLTAISVATITDEALKSVAKCQALKTLWLSGVPVTDKGLQYLAEEKMALQAFGLGRGSTVTSDGIKQLWDGPILHSISSLKFPETGVTAESLKPLFHAHRDHKLSLKLLSLAMCDQVNHELFQILLESPMVEIRELDLSGCNINDDSAKLLSQCTHLNIHSLDVSRTPMTGVGIRDLAKLTTLKSLQLRNLNFDLEAAKAIAGLPLETLMASFSNVGDDHLRAFAEGPIVKTLQNLELQSIPATVEGLKFFASQPFTSMQNLNLESFSGLNDESVAAIANSPFAKTLTYLNIGKSAVTEEGLKPLLEKTSIQTIGLNLCMKLPFNLRKSDVSAHQVIRIFANA